MSLLAHDSGDGFSNDPGVCIIKDVQYQFLPNLAAIYGDTPAVMIQQFYFLSREPYFKGEKLVVKHFEGLDFIQMWPFMWFDTLEGITKHLARSTWYRYLGGLKAVGAMRVESSLGERNRHSSRRNEEAVPSWYALNNPTIRLHTNAYQKAFDEALGERRAQREEIWREDKSAHWRPAPGEDPSKPLDSWRQLFLENWPKEAMPTPKKHGGKRVKSLESQLEIQSVSEVIESMNAEIGAVNAYESQVEIGPVSHPFQSQVEIGCSQLETVEQSQLETVEQSQLETLSNLKLRNAPYIDKTERSSKTESSDSTTTDTPPAVSSADADAVVKNQDFLSPDPAPATQPGLPGILASLLDEIPDNAIDLARRFQREAEDRYGIDCPDEIAAHVVTRFPVATMSDTELKRLIGPERAKIGLNTTIGGEVRKAMLADLSGLRWLVFTWPDHRAEVEAYYARKKQPPRLTGAFTTKWTEETAPSEGWIKTLIDEVKHALRSEANALRQARADIAWESLDARQRRVFDAEVFERVGTMIGSVDANKARVRLQLLNDDDFLASLTRSEAESAGPLDAAQEARAMSLEVRRQTNEQAQYKFANAAEATRMSSHAAEFARKIRSGQHTLDSAEDDAIARLFWGPSAAAYLRTLIEAILEKPMVEAA